MREMQGMMMMMPPVPWYTILGYLVILIPLFGSAILALNSMGRRNATKITTLVAGSFSMLMFLVMLIGHVGGSSISFKEVAMMMGGPGMSGPGGPIPDITVQLMTTSIGFYLLFLGSLGCIVSFFTSFKSDQ